MLDFRLYHDLRLQSPRILCQQWLASRSSLHPEKHPCGSLLISSRHFFIEQKSSKHCGNLIDPRSLLELFPHRIRISNSNILDWLLKKSPDICKKSIISNSERLRLIKWHRKKCALHSTFALCGNKNFGLFLSKQD